MPSTAPISAIVACNDADMRSVIVGQGVDIAGLYVLIARGAHLLVARQVRPQLEAMHLPLRVSGRHFLVDDAGTGGHPLYVTVAEHTTVAKRITMFDIALQDIGDGLDATMRVPGKAFQIFRRVVIPEIVHHQERIERIGIAEAKYAVEMDTCALHRRVAWLCILMGRIDMAVFSQTGL